MVGSKLHIMWRGIPSKDELAARTFLSCLCVRLECLHVSMCCLRSVSYQQQKYQQQRLTRIAPMRVRSWRCRNIVTGGTATRVTIFGLVSGETYIKMYPPGITQRRQILCFAMSYPPPEMTFVN